MKKCMQLLFFSIALCSELMMQNTTLYGMRSPVDGLEAPASFGKAKEKLWWKAVNGNHPYGVRTLLFCGVDPRITNNNPMYKGLNALHYAALMGYTDIVQMFINNFRNTPDEDFLNATDNRGNTALMWAAEGNHCDITQHLINAHLDLNAQNAQGETPLIKALHNFSEDVAHMLIDAHADINIQDKNGQAALTVAVASGRWREGYPNVVRHLITQPQLLINAQDRLGMTALMHAAKRGCCRIVLLLVRAGADKNIENFKHQTVYQVVEAESLLIPSEKAMVRRVLNAPQLPQNREKKCAICLQEDDRERTLLELCGHCFHTECIHAWFHFSKSCPLCKSEVPFQSVIALH